MSINANTIDASGLSADNITASKIASNTGIPEPSYCSAMTFTESFALNSSGVLANNATGQQLTVTNDGGVGGFYFLLSNQTWTSTSGSVSFELLFNSASDVTNGEIGIAIFQSGMANEVHLAYFPASGILKDVVADSTLATFTASQGSYRMGIKLDQSAGTATYQDNHSTPHSGSLSVAGTYDSADPSYFLFYANTPTSGETVITAITGSTAFDLSQSEGRWCDY